MSRLQPDYYFERYTDVTVDFLRRESIRTLLLDIDNTLAPYEQPDPDEENLRWFAALREAGIAFAFVSNNETRERIDRFNRDIGAPAYARSAKPLGKNLKRALRDLNADRATAAVMGDQIFTDVCAGKFHGMRAILVPPIHDKTTLFFRLKRALERPILRAFFKRQKKERKV